MQSKIRLDNDAAVMTLKILSLFTVDGEDLVGSYLPKVT